MPREIFSSKYGDIKLYSSAEVAQMHGIDEELVPIYVSSGEIKAEKIKDGWYIKDADLKPKKDKKPDPSKSASAKAAPGTQAGGKSLPKTVVYSVIGAALAILIVIVIMLSGSDEPKLACSSKQTRDSVIKYIAATSLSDQVAKLVRQRCTELSATDPAGYNECQKFSLDITAGLLSKSRIEAMKTVSKEEDAVQCEAVLDAFVKIPVAYTVTFQDGDPRVSVTIQ